MELKSGRPTIAGFATAGAAGAGAAAAWVVATARVAPAMYSTPTGAAMALAPRSAATTGFLMRFGRVMHIAPSRFRGPGGRYGHDRRGALWDP